MLDLVLVGGRKVGAHAAVMAGDDDTALAGGLGIIDAVLGVHAGLGAGLLQGVGELVLANAADVEDRILGEHVLDGQPSSMTPGLEIYLSTSRGVLSGTTGNQLRIPLEQLIVEAHVLVFGEDGIVVLQAVLLQEGSVAIIVSEAIDFRMAFAYPAAWISVQELGLI